MYGLSAKAWVLLRFAHADVLFLCGIPGLVWHMYLLFPLQLDSYHPFPELVAGAPWPKPGLDEL